MECCKSAKALLPHGLNLGINKSEVRTIATPFRQLIDSLLHLANTVGPDIVFATGYLSRFIHRPTEILWKSSMHVLRYSSGTEKLETTSGGSTAGSL